ncbi:hypothetical protein A3C91_01905 [Candidatus Azambacteria bacterium RIFCSPHIGHO2_02_FULL_52_12]|uniref:Gram-positive cocci surface proteins LPxTG domain-containing protein n=1 Tax=Candidatus Azambacteria bacterium RIFCSPLOWO2_01_FULL_46_25 TaxID=1797298 RepID=A0A1F5BVF4_9BACT|nr:MAG: hypothetical protein A3C91_01905 [Candidatus Azambacteria bacterium RIFCSPHIGHO2_02_FULL_52_12]OGD34593.1 MAG: hypothetical protein A2988_03765 [Candidatus Azambacteria bacterium RIFCSPLOWO2_01_FULL_46_25]OGD36618.1 MAG: hypothetical protein A2850_03180 [Candidatus Azambacteria bacterium RIFCSPHIGHO2_01_FULL_51_74]
MMKKTGFAVCLSLILGMALFSGFALADAGHDEAPAVHGMTTTATPAAQPSTQFPNAVGGFVIGVVVGIILARFIFKKS